MGKLPFQGKKSQLSRVLGAGSGRDTSDKMGHLLWDSLFEKVGWRGEDVSPSLSA